MHCAKDSDVFLRVHAEGCCVAQVGTIFQPLATYEMPPTYFPVSKVTSCFQTIVDAYGIARYREANPAVGIPPSLWVKFSLQLMQLPVRFSKDPSAFSLHMWVARITAHSLH